MNQYKPGRRVYWRDPDGGACSAAGKIVEGISEEDWKAIEAWEAGTGDEDVDVNDFMLSVVNDAGGEIQCMARELDLSCVSNGLHDGLTFGFGNPDDHGYFDIGDPVAARAAEKRDNMPVGSYWPFPN